MKRMIGATLGACAVLAVGSAGAEVLKATYTDSQISGSWEQDSNPTPASSSAGDYTQVPIWDATGDFASDTDVYFLNSSAAGGFNGFSGPQIYTGPESAPVFSVGSFTGIGENGGVLTFSVAVPEPSTWALMFAGFMGLAALSLGARRRTVAA